METQTNTKRPNGKTNNKNKGTPQQNTTNKTMDIHANTKGPNEKQQQENDGQNHQITNKMDMQANKIRDPMGNKKQKKWK